MMMMRNRWVIPIVPAVLLCSTSLRAQEATPKSAEMPADVKAILEQVDKTIYSAKNDGLKDLSFGMHISVFEQMMGVKDPVQLFWKAPDKVKVKVPDALAPMFPPEQIKQFEKTPGQLAGESQLDRLKGYSTKLEKDGELTKVVAKATDPTKDVSELTLWIDSNHLVTKMSQKLAKPSGPTGATSIDQELTYRKQGEKYVPIEMKSDQLGNRKIEYQQVSGFWFPSKFTIDNPNMGQITIEFKDVKANAGIEDSVFDSAPAEKSDKSDKPKEPEKKEG